MTFHLAFENANSLLEMRIVVKRHGQSMISCINPFNRIDLILYCCMDLIPWQQGKVQNTNGPAAWITILTAECAHLLQVGDFDSNFFIQHSACGSFQTDVLIGF